MDKARNENIFGLMESLFKENGYEHKEVNHLKEYVNKDGFHINKTEGQSGQIKARDTNGRGKFHYTYQLAEYLWRYKQRDKDPFWALLNDMKKVYISMCSFFTYIKF